MGKTVLVDLSHPFGRGNPLWPSNGDFHIDRVQHMPMHYRLLQTFNDFHMHNSTHADSPSHVIPESPYTHELPLENYYGPAVCLDIPKKHWELITVEDIEKAAAKVEGGIQEGDWVLICTGMNQRWGENDDYFMYSPGMSIEGAHWLVDHKVKGVGFDLQALDHILYTYAAQHGPGPYVPRIVDEYKKEFGHEPIEDYPEWEPVHTILLGNNVMGIENLGGDIEKVKGQRFMFCAFPLRWYMGDGTIVRAVAMIDEDYQLYVYSNPGLSMCLDCTRWYSNQRRCRSNTAPTVPGPPGSLWCVVLCRYRRAPQPASPGEPELLDRPPARHV